MGMSLPDDNPDDNPGVIFPVLVTGKFYFVMVDIYQSAPPPYSCASDWVDQQIACLPTLSIQNWIDNNWECSHAHELIFWSGDSAQRLIQIKGPYDNLMACLIG